MTDTCACKQKQAVITRENGQVVRRVENFSISCANSDTAVRSPHWAVRLLDLLTTFVLKKNEPQGALHTSFLQFIKIVHLRPLNPQFMEEDKTKGYLIPVDLIKHLPFCLTLVSVTGLPLCWKKPDPNRFTKCFLMGPVQLCDLLLFFRINLLLGLSVTGLKQMLLTKASVCNIRNGPW